MGYEKTLPSNHLIVLFTVMSVALLVGLHFAFDSYFNEVTASEISEKVLTVEPVKLNRLRADEARRLSAANVQAAKASMASGNRPDAITPQKGIDLDSRLSQLGALSGWAEDSRPLALAMARREEARGYLAEMRASVDKARSEGNQEALDTLLPRLSTAEEAYVRYVAEANELLGNQTEAGVAGAIRNPNAQTGDDAPAPGEGEQVSAPKPAPQPEGGEAPAPKPVPQPEGGETPEGGEQGDAP